MCARTAHKHTHTHTAYSSRFVCVIRAQGPCSYFLSRSCLIGRAPIAVLRRAALRVDAAWGPVAQAVAAAMQTAGAMSGSRVQAAVEGRLVRLWVDVAVVTRSARVLAGSPEAESFPDAQMAGASRRWICRLSPQWAFTTTHAYVASWRTSHRMPDARKDSCVFGCDGAEDTLGHYLVCSALLGSRLISWGLNGDAFGRPTSRFKLGGVAGTRFRDLGRRPRILREQAP